ncbi:hypothetical protein KI659_08880 [Litoribacter alkaliphilus]|uniref:UVR domain-containing protein n=1 Tax=Litoribacter ruber TaxID=702568 RepID=A0AAP2CI69_9BACT|nr:hypothetical protein [Litoribacter alkaliphilus]MBS9524124.1 hypothetical protein [Litoribacter alkaliphilus]
MDIDKKVAQLNALIAGDEIDREEFGSSLGELLGEGGLKVKVLDLEFYSKEKLEHAEREKAEAMRRQYYEEAAQWRDKANEIRQYVELGEDLQLTSSTFRIEHGHLFYFHTGLGKHDQLILKLIGKVG